MEQRRMFSPRAPWGRWRVGIGSLYDADVGDLSDDSLEIRGLPD